MPQDYSVPGPEPDPNDPWNANQKNETLETPNDVGAQFITPDTPDEQQSSGTGKTDSEEQNFSSSPTSEAELPPEARGEVNGGPLGCCLGLTIGLVLSLTLAVFGRLYLANPLAAVLHNALLTLILLRIAMSLLTLAAAILCGYFGWKLGKRFFREYEPPVIPVRPPRQKQRRRRAKTRPKEANIS